jgi:hypothetical protein
MITEEESLLIKLILKLQEPIPQYVLGCIPTIATIGTAPDDGLIRKILWMLRCLGCPFTGLFYFCNIGTDEIAMSAYWLQSRNFVVKKGCIRFRPFGHHSMELLPNPDQEEIMRECIAEASILDRLSSLASAYYILVGIFAGLARAIGPCIRGDWPYIPIALAWTLPAIYVRVLGGKVVFKDPRKKLGDDAIFVMALEEDKFNAKNAHAVLTIVLSVVIPWTSVFLAYFTPPIGFGCRSKYLTVFCSIWTFNSIIAYIFHIRGEKTVSGNRFIYCLFCTSGAIIAVLFTVLAFLSNSPSWWIKLFGETCDNSKACTP